MPPGRGSISATVPCHWTSSSGSVRNGQIVSGVASIMISRTSSAISALLLVSLGSFGDVTESLQPRRPVLVEELTQLLHLAPIRAIQAARPGAALAHQARGLEDREVLRDRGTGDLGK